MKDHQQSQRILFCNYAYLIQPDFDLGEADNFAKCDDGYCRGYVELNGNTLDNYRQIHIENIDIAAKGADEISGVTVILCAKQSVKEAPVIIGWYKNATVYRNIQKHNERAYYFKALAENVHIVPPARRNFVVPRANKDEIGQGQCGIWYAQKPEAQQFIDEVLKYIDEQI